MSCINKSDFGKYYKENMDALGLSAPADMYNTYKLSLAHTLQIATSLEMLGKGASIAELAIATTIKEKLIAVGALGAAGYLGASIGSMAVASGRVLSCGSRIADMFAFTTQNRIQFKNQNLFYRLHPEIFDHTHSKRKSYGVRLRVSPAHFDFTV